MKRYPLLAVPALVGSLLLLSGALGRQPPPSTPPPAPAPAAGAPGVHADQLLADAAEALAPGRLAWTEMNLWQQVVGDGQTYQTVGRYVAGPGQRLRLELHVQVGKTRGELRLVS